jgi:putative nucleotidyltransferase with HDIG domain
MIEPASNNDNQNALTRQNPRERVIVVFSDRQAIAGLLQFLSRDYDVAILESKADIFEEPDLGNCQAVLVGEPPCDMPIKDFCDRISNLERRPGLVLVVERPESPWASWTAIAEEHSVVNGLIGTNSPPEFQINAFRLFASTAADRRIESFSPAARTIWRQTKETLNSLLTIIQSGEPLPRSVVRQLATTVVETATENDLREMVCLLRTHHNDTVVHSLDLAIVAVLLARQMGIHARTDHHYLFEIGMLHDIGKLAMPISILQKPGPLDAEERAVMRGHPLESERILRESGEFDEIVINAAVQHHEKLDGTGYPYELPGAKLSEIGRMVAVCDVYCALTEKRAYKAQLSADDAFAIMRKLCGNHLDPMYVNAMADMVFGRSTCATPMSSAFENRQSEHENTQSQRSSATAAE